MKHIALTFLFASGVAIAAAQNSDSEIGILHTNWRKELHAAYVFAPPSKILSSASIPSSVVSIRSDDQTLVKLPEFVVRDSPFRFTELGAAIRQSQAAARATALSSKLGIGSHVWRRKQVMLGVTTIFYIPVGFGIAW